MLTDTLAEKLIKSIALNPGQALTPQQTAFLTNTIIPYLRREQVVWLSVNATNINVRTLARNYLANGNAAAIPQKRAVVNQIEFGKMFWDMFPQLHLVHGTLARYLKTL